MGTDQWGAELNTNQVHSAEEDENIPKKCQCFQIWVGKPVERSRALAKCLFVRTILLGRFVTVLFGTFPGKLTSDHFLSSQLLLISSQEPTFLNITLRKRKSTPSTKNQAESNTHRVSLLLTVLEASHRDMTTGKVLERGVLSKDGVWTYVGLHTNHTR